MSKWSIEHDAILLMRIKSYPIEKVAKFFEKSIKDIEEKLRLAIENQRILKEKFNKEILPNYLVTHPGQINLAFDIYCYDPESSKRYLELCQQGKIRSTVARKKSHKFW